MKKAAQTLPELKNWAGGFEDLVTTANRVLPSLCESASPITPRLARRYQEAGALGRGQKQGKSARFGWNDLAALAMTKAIVQRGWPLEGAAALVSSTPPEALASRLLDASAPDTASQADPSADTAQRVISELMYQTDPVVSAPALLTSTASMGQCAVQGFAQSANAARPGWALRAHGAGLAPVPPQAEPSPPAVWHKHVLAPWLELNMEPIAAGQATHAEVNAAASALRALADALPDVSRKSPARPQPSPTQGTKS